MAGEIDLTQFHEVFYEESFENLDAMEAGLLGFKSGAPDPEQVNTVFRAAHSIKGGAATFGLLVISDFTHVVETLLDQVRAGERMINESFVDIMLESVDLIRTLLADSRAGNKLDEGQSRKLREQLESLEQNRFEPAGQISPANECDMEGVDSTTTEWQISFKPGENMLRSGNEPFRMIRELKTLGEVTVQPDYSQLPEFTSLDPEGCFIQWQLLAKGTITRRQIEEVFEWVEDDCDLEIEELSAPQSDGSMPAGASSQAANSAPQPKFTPVSHPNRRAADRITQAQEATTIRVGISKVDNLIDLVGELVITQSMLNRFTREFREEDLEKLIEGIEQLERNTRELQEHAMRIRMLPIDFVFQRVPRLVRDLSQSLGKQVDLRIEGSQTEVDKTVLEKMTDPLMHLIRNALDHGIETPRDRQRLGKPATGIVTIRAFHEGGNVIIQIEDDGKGLNPELLRAKAIDFGIVSEEDDLSETELQNLIFAAGFSTAETISEVSGRGVGMDVVSKNISDLGGTVDVSSQVGKGSLFSIKLPLTLAILDGQLIRVGEEIYIISMLAIDKSIRVSRELYGDLAGGAEVYRFQDDYIPIIRLSELYGIKADYQEIGEAIMVVVDAGQKFGLLVDEVLGQQQVVIKSIESNFRPVPGIAGATILGDGRVAMILDSLGLLSYAKVKLGQR